MLGGAMSSAPEFSFSLIEEARERIAGKVNLTPVLTSSTLDAQSGAQLFFKCENFQKAGAFKARGATNAVFALTAEEARRGVATHSSGNHAAALTRAARLRGIPSHVVMPDNSSAAKRAAVQRYGADITLCAPTLAARESTAREVVERTGATLIHPYDNLLVMAGQGTAAAELLSQVADLDVILCPVGGGGLLAGTAMAAKTLRPKIRVIGVEPAGADDAQRSLRAGHIVPCAHPDTIADGLRAARVGEHPFRVIRARVDDILTVPDSGIIAAMQELWAVLKIVVEPSAAVPYAALRGAHPQLRGARIGVILSGGNVDLGKLPWLTPARE
jgi:threonine dehydratase